MSPFRRAVVNTGNVFASLTMPSGIGNKIGPWLTTPSELPESEEKHRLPPAQDCDFHPAHLGAIDLNTHAGFHQFNEFHSKAIQSVSLKAAMATVF